MLHIIRHIKGAETHLWKRVAIQRYVVFSGGVRVEEICLVVVFVGDTFDAEIYEMKHE